MIHVPNKRIDNESQMPLLKAIAKMQRIPLLTVAKMLRYNTVTVSQVAKLTGKSGMTIRGMLQPAIKKGKPTEAKLTRCYIHQEWDGEKEVDGSLLIERDKKCEEFLWECNS